MKSELILDAAKDSEQNLQVPLDETMILNYTRTGSRHILRPSIQLAHTFARNKSSIDANDPQKSSDPRLAELGRAIEDDYATLREEYSQHY